MEYLLKIVLKKKGVQKLTESQQVLQQAESYLESNKNLNLIWSGANFMYNIVSFKWWLLKM